MSMCIEWDGGWDSRGYGRRWFNGRVMWAHRAAWLEAGREIPEGYVIHHDCENLGCVNVDHLRVVTQGEHRWIHSERITHCINGHEYTPENTYLRAGKYRKCRACNRAKNKIRDDRRAAIRREAMAATKGAGS